MNYEDVGRGMWYTVDVGLSDITKGNIIPAWIAYYIMQILDINIMLLVPSLLQVGIT